MRRKGLVEMETNILNNLTRSNRERLFMSTQILSSPVLSLTDITSISSPLTTFVTVNSKHHLHSHITPRNIQSIS